VTDVSELTNAGLAGLLGISERRVATVRAENRLPLTPCGTRIDGLELLRRGWAVTLAEKGQGQPIAFPEATAEERATLKGLAPVLDFTEPLHQGFVLAALLSLHEAPIAAILALAEVGVSRGQAERVADLLVVLLWTVLNEHARALGLPDPEGDGPIYAATDMRGWRAAVNWSELFGPDGASLVAGAIERESRAEMEAELAEAEAAGTA
jgi:hypothetical protein